MTFYYSSTDEQNFLKNIIKTFLADGTEHCWLWQGSKNTNGYGYFSNSSNTSFAHRFSVQYHGRVIPEGLEIHHTCEIRSCVYPKHLMIVTHQENMNMGIGMENIFNDINYVSPEKKTKYDQVLEYFSGIACNKNKSSNDVIIEMIDIKSKTDQKMFNFDLDYEEGIQGYKRKYFWILDEILKQYDFTYDDILHPKPVQP